MRNNGLQYGLQQYFIPSRFNRNSINHSTVQLLENVQRPRHASEQAYVVIQHNIQTTSMQSMTSLNSIIVSYNGMR